MLVCVYRTLSSYNEFSLKLSTFWSLNYYYNNINRILLYSISRCIYTQGGVRQMVLDLLVWIRSNMDRTLSFRSSCCEGVCGSCAMLINNLNTLACIQPIWLIDSYIIVYPLPHFNVIRDLVVDLKHFYEQYYYISPFYNNTDASGFSDSLYSINILYNLRNCSSIFMDMYIYNNVIIQNVISILHNCIYKFFMEIISEFILSDIFNINFINYICISRSFLVSNF
jgi:hypothetical protein